MENLQTSLREKKRFMIFGAGENDWLNIRREIVRRGSEISYYVVSTKKGNPDKVDNVLVKELDEICGEDKKNGIVISNALDKQKEIALLLKERGFQTVFYGIRRYSCLSGDEQNYYKNCGWNICMDAAVQKMTNKNVVNNKNLRIYVVTSHLNLHSTNTNFISDLMCYIQAGSALTEKSICELKDNTGDNISERNRFFCELTAGYWIYKNDNQHDYVGLYHYSRVFDIDEKEIVHILSSGINVILSEPLICFSCRKNFWDCEQEIRESISRCYPEYIETYDQYMESGLFIPSNMIIAKKEIFNQYYEWLFDVLDEYEKVLKNRNWQIGARSMGYLAEELTGIYFLYHSEEWEIFYVRQKDLY